MVTQHFSSEQKNNAVPVVSAYVCNFVMSFLHSHVRRLRLDDLYTDADSMPRAVAALLGLESDGFSHWWNKTSWTKGSPKNYSTWIEGHASAFMPPIFSDTTAQVSGHAYWRAVLPIFDKYFHPIDAVFDEKEVLADLDVLYAAWKKHSMTVSEAFDSFRSVKVKELVKRIDGKLVVSTTEGIEKCSGKSWKKIEIPEL